MFRDESQSENHLERSNSLPVHSDSQSPEVQRKRMLIALGILLAALAAVLLKDWDFWFPPKPEIQEAAVRNKNRTLATVPESVPAAPAHERKAQKTIPPATNPALPFSATAERAALPALQVEVVAGNRHIAVPAKSNAIHLDVGSGATSTTATSGSGSETTTRAGEQVQMSPQTAQSVTVSVPPDYPLLARQMKVQGAVSLQALISRDGSIQELQILSGPGILAAADREAVKQWHFKPFLQNGQPVETQARITVNFTISTN